MNPTIPTFQPPITRELVDKEEFDKLHEMVIELSERCDRLNSMVDKLLSNGNFVKVRGEPRDPDEFLQTNVTLENDEPLGGYVDRKLPYGLIK